MTWFWDVNSNFQFYTYFFYPKHFILSNSGSQTGHDSLSGAGRCVNLGSSSSVCMSLKTHTHKVN